MLDAVGLDGAQEAAYKDLVEHGPRFADDLRRRIAGAGLDPDAADRALGGLLAGGLVFHGTDGRLSAASPATALSQRLLEREESLRAARSEIDRLADRFRHSASGRLPSEVVELAEGSAAVAERFTRLQAGAAHEVLATVRADVAAVGADDAADAEEKALARGVAYRVLIERESLERPGFYAAIAKVQQMGSTVRVARTVPVRMLIADRQTAMVPLGSAATGAEGALLIHPSGLLDAMVLLFEELWEKGTELSPAHATARGATVRPDGVDRQLLTLLLAGVSDRAIAAHLGLSLRTVQRRLRTLMDEAGVDTRLQLGFEAGRRGWLPRGISADDAAH